MAGEHPTPLLFCLQGCARSPLGMLGTHASRSGSGSTHAWATSENRGTTYTRGGAFNSPGATSSTRSIHPLRIAPAQRTPPALQSHR